jgi:hypothetical protein
MYKLIVISSIFLFLFSYGAIGGYLAAQGKTFENSIIELLHVLKWSYFWPIMLIIQRKNEKKIL